MKPAMVVRRTIVSFDLATKTGVAYGYIGGRPTLETWKLEGKTRPYRLYDLQQRVEAFLADNAIDLVGYEKPLPLRALLNIGSLDETIQMLRSCIGIVEAATAKFKLPVATWTAQEARKGVIGTGKFPHGLAKKKVMEYAWMLGYRPDDDNQADALIGFLYQSGRMNPRIAHLSTPMFAAG